MKAPSDSPFRPELHRNHLRMLVRLQLNRAGPLKNKIDASDIVQEVLLQAVNALPKFRGSTDAEFSAWLQAILVNKLTDAVRHFGRKKRDAVLEESFRRGLNESSKTIEELLSAKSPSPSKHMLLHERAELLAAVLEKLPEDQRTVIEYHHLLEYSVIETAEVMGRTPDAVAGLLRRGLKALRNGLEDYRRELR